MDPPAPAPPPAPPPSAPAPGRAAAPPPATASGAPTMPAPTAPATDIPWLGLLAVLMGTFISTLNGRLSNFGLADIRGAVGDRKSVV